MIGKLSKYVLHCFALALLASCNEDDHLAGVDEVVVAELERLGITPISDAETSKNTLFEPASPIDGLKAEACDKAGYHDLYSYAGETVESTSVNIRGSCEDIGIRVIVITKNSLIVCIFLTFQRGEEATPGIWPINDSSCEY